MFLNHTSHRVKWLSQVLLNYGGINVKNPKNFKEDEATPIIAHTEKKGFVDHTQAQLAKLQKKEKP
jgi:hypothetical protein